MAAIVELKEVSPEQIKAISGALTLQPVDASVEEQKKWGKRSYSTPKPSIIMYQLTPDQKKIILPYRFACCLFNKIFNHEKKHLKMITDNKPAFGASLREYQVEPAMEAYHYLFAYGTTTLGLPPGWGKTIIGAWLAYLAGYVTLVFVHRDTIARQWIKTFSKCIPDYTPYIWMVGESPAPTAYVPPIIICMDGRYEHIPENIKTSIGTVIIDEAHLFCTPDRAPQAATVSSPARVGCLLSLEPRYVIVETATLERDDKMHTMMHAIAGEHGAFRISQAPYLVYCVETGVLVEEKKTTRGTSYVELCKQYALHAERNLMILDIVTTNPHCKFMILGQVASHVETLSAMFTHVGIKNDTLYRSKSTYSDSQVLIGTIPKMGTGFDEENACEDFKGVKSNVIILVNSMKKWQLYEQIRGRVMRSSFPIVVWLNDRNPMPRRHFSKLTPWIEHTNGKIVHLHYMPNSVILPVEPPSKRV